ncbi:MAG: tRNA glutamyl-Q(34) synthetase GluQRS [Oleiphilaceae bacterium]|nr:tRNA glutamyl-Q(34) synthetase GluQRS [Oleiphilaceae bacterium]
MTALHYRGRFAPSPTGPLHFGSLVTAVASFLEAKAQHGLWLVRIEDLDPLREPPGAADIIVRSLDAHGLHSDEPIRYQSRRHDAFAMAIEQLTANQSAYPCPCSRKLLQATQGRHVNGCRDGSLMPGDQPHAIRFALTNEESCWQDLILGPQRQVVRAEIDDPVIRRKEGFYAYQLAVVVDDIDQGITDVVRGSDLLDMTAQQQQIFQALGARAPNWLHIPVILNSEGQKLSKQSGAPALDDRQAGINVWRALAALGQAPPEELRKENPASILAWGIASYDRKRLPDKPQKS